MPRWHVSPEQWVSLICDRAADLRAAGVQSISIDGATVTLYEGMPVVATKAEKIPPGPPERPTLSPLDDPETFGGILPGYDFPVSSPGALE